MISLLVGAAVVLCHARGPLPDSSSGCTPGATDPRVTQATIASTICKRGYATSVRPSLQEARNLKRAALKLYGYKGSWRLVEGDHLIPVELGGAVGDVHNVWPEMWAGAHGAHAKDRIENSLKRDVCAGRITLAAAQRQMVTDWEHP